MALSARKKWLLALPLTCAVGIAIYGAVRGVRVLAATASKRQALEDLHHDQSLARADGIPLTTQDFNSPSSDDDNAAPLYEKAGKLLSEIGKSQELNAGLNAKDLSDPTQLAAAVRTVKLAAPAMEIVAEGAGRPAFDLDPGKQLSEPDFSMLASFKLFAKLAALKAQVQTQQGSAALGLQNLATLAPISAHLSKDPATLTIYVQCAVERVFERTISEILTKHGRAPGVAAAAGKALKALGNGPDLVRVAEAQNVRLLEHTIPSITPKPGAKPTAAELADKDVGQVVALSYKPGMIDRWRVEVIDLTRKLVALYRSAGDNWSKVAKDADEIMDEFSKPPNDSHVFIKFVTGEMPSDYIKLLAMQRSTRRVLAQSIAVFQAWNRDDKLPHDLPLHGVALQDPFNFGKLGYMPLPTGFTITGSGPDGFYPSNLGPQQHYDNYFTYPPKPAVVKPTPASTPT